MPMGKAVHFVFSNPPPGVSDLKFSRWYERHVSEIVETPGFAGARRYWLSPIVGDRSPTMYRHLSLYELDGDSEAPLRELDRRMRAGQLTLEDWFGDIRFASFDGSPLEADPVRLSEHLYLVFSTPPPEVDFDAYSEWYAVHLRENLTAEGFDAGWRFRLAPVNVDPPAPCAAVHGAIYEVSAELPALRRALDDARDAGRVHFPDWFGRIEFASLDCLAISPHVAAAVRA
jgi:hypothetical protein